MNSILIFLKAPREGVVKTRLAADVGSHRALLVYKALVQRQMAELEGAERIEVHFTPTQAAQEMSEWLGKGAEYFPQCEGDLGARLRKAVDEAFARGATSVTCIGGDCPRLTCRHVAQAMDLLTEGNDAVFGPSEDGGYYLLAMRRPQLGLFEGIPWSSEDTLKASLARADVLGLKVGLLENLYDVDGSSDLERALAEGFLAVDP